MADTPDGPLVEGMYDPFGAEIARERLASAIKDNREFILITQTPGGSTTYVSCSKDTRALLGDALVVYLDVQRRKGR